MTTDHGFVINILVVFALIIDVSLLSVSEILILEERVKGVILVPTRNEKLCSNAHT